MKISEQPLLGATVGAIPNNRVAEALPPAVRDLAGLLARIAYQRFQASQTITLEQGVTPDD